MRLGVAYKAGSGLRGWKWPKRMGVANEAGSSLEHDTHKH